MAIKSGGFYEGLAPSSEIIVSDEFNWEKLPPEIILSVSKTLGMT